MPRLSANFTWKSTMVRRAINRDTKTNIHYIREISIDGAKLYSIFYRNADLSALRCLHMRLRLLSLSVPSQLNADVDRTLRCIPLRGIRAMRGESEPYRDRLFRARISAAALSLRLGLFDVPRDAAPSFT
jgi:hypothetical protein